MRCWVVLSIALCACGDVNKIEKPVPVDAFQADSPPEVSCASGETVCGGTCSNPMTDEANCGACNTQCAPTQGCLNGSCVPAGITCARIRELDPTAPDGLYRHPHTNAPFYCDFTNQMTYDGIAMGQYTTAYPGYTVMAATDLDKVDMQKAFILFTNQQNGLPALSAFVSNNCCFSTAGGLRQLFGGQILYPANGATARCNQAPSYNTPPYIWTLNGAVFFTLPLPDNFFTTYPPTTAATCTEGNNPGFFWRSHGL